MRSGTALLWKEWREIRWFLVAGAAIFIGWPLLEAAGNYLTGRGFYSADMPKVMALFLGGPFAILVAVGVTCRDLKEEITYFWQSRPVSIRRWAVTKYLVGLAVVLIVLCVPLVMKIFVMKAEHELGQLSGILTCHTFTVILIYSISFLAGCLIRMPVYAVIFSGALAILVYFLPVLIPPLENLSVFNIMMQSSRYNIDLLRYIAFALVGSFAAVVLSGIAVKRNWRLQVGQKLMFWLLGGVGMLLFLTVVFQLRSNLTCFRQIPLGPYGVGGRRVMRITCDGNKGVLLLHVGKPGYETTYYSLMIFDLSAKEPLGEEIVLTKDQTPMSLWRNDGNKLVWSAKNPQWAYLIKTLLSEDKTDDKAMLSSAMPKLMLDSAELLTVPLATGAAKVVDKLDLSPYLEDRTTLWHSLYMLNSTIYASVSDKLFIFDVGTDGKPVLRKVVKERFGVYGGDGVRDASERARTGISVRLVPAEGLSTEERLKITVALSSYYLMASEGDIVVEASSVFLKAYRLKEVIDDIATLEMTGFRRPTPLERFVGTYPSQVFVRDGLTYMLGGFGVTIYDVRQPQYIKRIGHYAAPDEMFLAIAPLPDGNILVGGSKLHIVRPPKVKR